MNSLPVIAREMLTGSRRPATYWQRTAAAVAALTVAVVILVVHSRSTRPSELSLRIFWALSILGFGYALLSGVFLTTDCICSERREGTLPLLFLTRLRGVDVALGKLVSTSLVAGYALLAIMPVLGLSLLMGAVTGAEFARVCLALVVTLLFSLTTGLLCSTICRDTRAAMGTTFALQILLAGLLFVVSWTLEMAGWRRAMNLLVFSPLGAFLDSFDFYHRRAGGAWRYNTSILLLTCASFIQFVAAGLLMKRATDDQRGIPRNSAPAIRSKQRPVFSPEPFTALLLRERYPTPAIQAVCGILTAIWAGCLWASLRGSGGRIAAEPLYLISVFTAFVFHALIKSLVAAQASKAFAEFKQTGALELLLSTPLKAEEIVAGQCRALWKQFRFLLALAFLMNVLLAEFTIINHSDALHMPSEIQFLFCCFFLGGALLLAVDYFALMWVGMSEAMQGKRHHRAILAAFLRVLIPGWVALFLCIFMMIGLHPDPGGVIIFYGLWAILCGFFAAMTGATRRDLMILHFREYAAGEAPARTSTTSSAAVVHTQTTFGSGWPDTGNSRRMTP